MINKYDILIILIIAIIIAVIVAINVKKTLNDKLSNIEVKIPQIEIPQPNIIVKVQKKCDSEEFDVHIDKEDTKTKKQIVGLSPISHMKEINTNAESEIEKFETIKGETPNEDRICLTRAEYDKLNNTNSNLNSKDQMREYN